MVTVGTAAEPLAGVPEHIRESLTAYIERRRPCGHFLTAVLSNDLREAMGRADETSRNSLYEIVRYLYNRAPADCWGTPQAVREWLRRER